ncbi:hypothetical protein [Syntrophomonas palmitatica]|uniref:hypothetical protein n=1 Tax=Syntrophomonas palmitatica TaxID=402877 RepID=UPI0006D085BF|nr:hypothetical protein [Syntrophomonas palmitatica]
MRHLAIFSGGFGSGKTEIAVNFALQGMKNNESPILIDLDFVNPFFASRDVKGMLAESGVRLVAPSGELAFGDVPQVPPEVLGLLQQDNSIYLDLAGDEVGATVLGYLSRFIQDRPCDFYLVLNPYRPFAGTSSELQNLRELLQKAGRRRFTAIISNPNLVEDTNLEVIMEGHRRVLELADALQLPVSCLTVEERFYNELPPEYQKITRTIKLYLRPEWLQES